MTAVRGADLDAAVRASMEYDAVLTTCVAARGARREAARAAARTAKEDMVVREEEKRRQRKWKTVARDSSRYRPVLDAHAIIDSLYWASTLHASLTYLLTSVASPQLSKSLTMAP